MAKNTVIVSVLADTKQFAKGFQESESTLGRIGQLGKTVAKTVAGVGLAIGGIALAGGFSRALKLDEANTQLKALGYNTQQIDSIMGSALASVKGTAFGLDSAATIAANALASGVPEGERLTRALTTVANTAALAKVDMGEMGSVFQKVWANGKVTTQEMNQLADRGVPIWQYLSEAFGVSNAELRKMIERGEITADMFENALGPAVEGMATSMSSSFKGMAANALAALSRVGAMFAGPLLDAAKGFLGEATTLTDALGERLQPVADRFAAWLGTFSAAGAAGTVIAFLDKMLGYIPQLIEFATTFSPIFIALRALGPVLPVLGAAFAELANALASVLLPLLPQLAKLLTAITVALVSLLPPIVQFLAMVIEGAAGLVTWIAANADWLSAIAAGVGIIAGIVGALTLFRSIQLGVVAATYGAQGAYLVAGTAAKVYGAITKTQTAITAAAAGAQRAMNLAMAANPIGLIVTAITALVGALVWFFTQTELGQQIWGEFTRFLGEAWTNIVNLGTSLWEGFASFFTDLWNGIVSFVTPIFETIATIIRTYIEVWVNVFLVFAAVLKTIWDGIVAVVTAVWDAIVAFVTPIVTAITSFVTTQFTNLRAAWTAIWGAVRSFFEGIWNGIVNFLTPIVVRVINAVRGPVDALSSWWSGIWSSISSFFSGAWNGMVRGVSDAVNRIGGVVRGIWDLVMGALGNVGSWLLSAGGDLIRGFWNGINGMLGWLQSKVTGFFDGVVGWAKGVLGIQSPSRVFRGIGEFLGQGLGQGIDRTRSLVNRSVGRLADTVVDGFDARLDAGELRLAVSGGASASSTAPVYHITVQALAASPEIGRAVVEAIREYERVGGRQ